MKFFNDRGKVTIKTMIFTFLITCLFLLTILHQIGFATENKNQDIIQQIKQTQNKIILANKAIGDLYVKYWIHKIGDIEIKNDYILLQTDIKDSEIIKYEKHWRDIQIIATDVLFIEFNDIDIAWKKPVFFIEKNDLNNFYSIDIDQEFPLLCWEVRYNNGRTSLININGEKIGEGIPAPSDYKGFSLSGYAYDSLPDCWRAWRENSYLWFKKWCRSISSISLPSPDIISDYVSDSEYFLFYELAHGCSTYFQADNPGVYYYASDVEEDLLEREKMVFSFIGSCEGMTNIGDGTLSYEFRKGSLNDTVTIGYSGMSTCPGWSDSLQWQDFMFYVMNSNYTIKDAFDLACAEYPSISDCVVFLGDQSFKIIERDQDELLPNLLITYPIEYSIVNGGIKITGTADDLGGEVSKIYIRIDNGEWQETSGTYSWELFWDTTTVSDGLHNITAIAIRNNGYKSDYYHLNVYVINDFLETNIIALNQSLVNQEINFHAITTGGLPPYSYHWDFDDGTLGYDSNPIHKYNKRGEYNIQLTIKDSINNTNTNTKNILIINSDNISPVIEIIKPENALYIGNNKILSLPFILVFGGITVEIQVSDLGGSGLEKVEFFIDDNLKETYSNSSSICQWTWDTIEFFKHKITIKTYDNVGNFNIKDIEIYKFG